MAELAQMCSETTTEADAPPPPSFCDIIANRKKEVPEIKNPHPKTPVANKNPIVKPPHVVKSGGIHKNPDMFHVSDEDISSSGWSASDSDDAKKAAKKTLFDKSKAKRVNKVAKQAENGSDSDTPWVRAKEAVKAKALAESKLKVEDEIRTDKLKSLGKPSNDEFRKKPSCEDIKKDEDGKPADEAPKPDCKVQVHGHAHHEHEKKLV